MSLLKREPRSLPCLPSLFGGAFCPVTSPTTSWVLAHDVISAIPSLCFRVRDNIRRPLRRRSSQGPCSLHRVPVARHRARGHASLARRGRPCNGFSCSCDLLVRVGCDGRARGFDRWPCRCVVSRRFGTIRLAGMGMVGSRALDDRLRLSHSALVSTLARGCEPSAIESPANNF